jgi:hypothetical protein
LRVPLLAGLVLTLGCATTRDLDPPDRIVLDAPSVRIPLREEPDNLFSLEVFLEGAGPYRFLLDSGAGVTVLDPVVAERFLANGEGLPFRVRGALGGEPRAVPRGALAEVSFQPQDAPGARIHDVPFVSQAVPHSFDGVAGLALFRGCRVVFDFPSRFVEASRTGGSIEDTPVGDHGLPQVTLVVEDVELEATVDTGFSGVVYLPAKEAATLKNLGPPVRIAILVDVHGRMPVEERHLRGNLRAGSGTVSDPWVLVGEGGALLGNGFLRGYRVAFDGRGRFTGVEAAR